MEDDTKKPVNKTRRNLLKSGAGLGLGYALGTRVGKAQYAIEREWDENVYRQNASIAFEATLDVMKKEHTVDIPHALEIFDAFEKEVKKYRNASLTGLEKRAAQGDMAVAGTIGAAAGTFGALLMGHAKSIKKDAVAFINDIPPAFDKQLTPEEVEEMTRRRKNRINMLSGAVLGSCVIMGASAVDGKISYDRLFPDSPSHQAARETLEGMAKDTSIGTAQGVALFDMNLKRIQSDREDVKEDAIDKAQTDGGLAMIAGGFAGRFLMSGSERSHAKKVKAKAKDTDKDGPSA